VDQYNMRMNIHDFEQLSDTQHFFQEDCMWHEPS